MRRDAVNFLRREDGRKLVDFAAKPLAQHPQPRERSSQRLLLRHRHSVGVEAVGGKAKTDVAGIVLLRLSEELRQPGVLAQQQWQNTGGHRVQRSQVSNRFFARNSANDRNDVVGSYARRFVEYKKAVHAASSLVAKTSFPDAPEKGTHCESATAT